jgi:hypothetical protein
MGHPHLGHLRRFPASSSLAFNLFSQPGQRMLMDMMASPTPRRTVAVEHWRIEYPLITAFAITISSGSPPVLADL